MGHSRNTLYFLGIIKSHIYSLFSAAMLMHKYNAHGATDVTGFGILGHADNLAQNQKNNVTFVINKLPVFYKCAAVAKTFSKMFKLLEGYLPETSGKYDFTLWKIRYSSKENYIF